MNRLPFTLPSNAPTLLRQFASPGGAFLLILFAALSLATGGKLPATAEETGSDSAAPTFNRDIRPILSNHCYACHGPDSAARKAGLRLDHFDHATGADSGFAAIVPGNSAVSEVWHRITSDDPDDQMPPPKSTNL